MGPSQKLQGLAFEWVVWSDDGDCFWKTLEVGSVLWVPSIILIMQN